MAAKGRKSQSYRAVELLRKNGVMRRREFCDAGLHPKTRSRLVKDDILVRVTRGFYQVTDFEIAAPHRRPAT